MWHELGGGYRSHLQRKRRKILPTSTWDLPKYACRRRKVLKRFNFCDRTAHGYDFASTRWHLPTAKELKVGSSHQPHHSDSSLRVWPALVSRKPNVLLRSQRFSQHGYVFPDTLDGVWDFCWPDHKLSAMLRFNHDCYPQPFRCELGTSKIRAILGHLLHCCDVPDAWHPELP